MSEIILRKSGVPVPDEFMSTADQETILGNGTRGDPLRASPDLVGGGGLSVVFRPGGVATQNVVTRFADAIERLSRSQGDRVLQFDDSVQPIVIPNGPGGAPWPMLGVTWQTYPGRISHVEIPEGTSFSGLRTILGVRVTFSGATPPIVDLGASGAPVGSLTLGEGAAITVSGSGPLIRVSHPAGLNLGDGAGVLTGSSAVINIPVATSLSVFADGAFATLRPQTVSGDEDAFLLLRIADSAAGDSSGSLSTDQLPAFAGTIQPGNSTASRSYPTSIVSGGGAINLDTASLTVRYDPSGGAILIFLPAASLVEGQDVTAKNVTASVAADGILVAKGSDTIDGAVNLHVSGAHASATVRSNGVDGWMVVAKV